MSNIKERLITFREQLNKAPKLNVKGQRLKEQLNDPAIISRYLGGGQNALVSGLSQFFSDEGLGAARAYFGGFPELKEQLNLQQSPQNQVTDDAQIGTALERMGQDDYRESDPIKAMALETVGLGIPQLIMGKRLMPNTLARGKNLVSKVAPSLFGGAVVGAGEAEGGLENTVDAAAQGAVVSAAAEGALKLAAQPFKYAFNAIKSLKRNSAKEGNRVAMDLLRESIKDDNSGSFDGVLKTLLEKSGYKKLKDEVDKEFTLADIGPNTQALLGAAQILPGPGKTQARKFLEQRNLGRGLRFNGYLEKAFPNNPKASFFDTLAALKSGREKYADPLYKIAYTVNIPVDEKMKRLLRRPSMQTAFKKAYQLAREESEDIGSYKLSEGGEILADKVGEEGAVKAINTRFLHYMKRAVDSEIYNQRPSSIKKSLDPDSYRTINETRKEFLDLIDSRNPNYKKARAIWAGTSKSMELLDMGRDIFNGKLQNLDIVLEQVKNMNPAEKESLRMGVMQGVADKLGVSGDGGMEIAAGNPARNFLKNTKNMTILKATFPNEKQFNTFRNNLLDENTMTETSNMVFGNSLTEMRRNFTNRIKDAATDDIITDPRISSLVPSLLRSRLRGVADEQIEATSAALVNALTKSGADVKKIFNEIEKGGKPKLLQTLARFGVAIPKIRPAAKEAASYMERGREDGTVFGSKSLAPSTYVSPMMRGLLQ